MGKAKKSAAKPSSRAKAAAPSKPAKQAASRATKAKQAASLLRPVPLYEFSLGGLTGYVRLTDPGRGLEFSGAAEGKSLPAFCQEALSLRHYSSHLGSGLLAPRESAQCVGKVDGDAAIFTYAALPNWPVTATARYELLPSGGADAIFAFGFSQGIPGFEAGVETLLPKSLPAIYVHTAGSWTRAQVAPQTLRFYPRNVSAAGLMADGRWEPLRRAGMSLLVEPHGYDYPIVVARDERTGWALVHMALTEECGAIWLNGSERAIGLGLIGADVAAKQKLTCRVRVALCRAGNLDDALTPYREFVQQARARR
jgi:hypothetical protein